MRKLIVFALALVCFSACQKSIEDRAEQEAREYTEKLCPTPVQNFTRTDSLTFARSTRTFSYYSTVVGAADSPEMIRNVSGQLHSELLKSIQQSTQLKTYKEEGFSFRYIIRSEKNPTQVLYEVTFTPKDYQ